MAAMTGNGCREIGQNVQSLKVAGFADGQQARRGQFALGAAVAEADLAPLHTGAQGALDAVVGRLDALVLQEDEEPVVMLEKSRGQIANLAVRALPVLLRQRVNPFSNGDRSLQQLAAIDLATAEFVPQSEESGVLGQGIAAESLHRATLGQLYHPKEIAFQVRPAELRLTGVILQIGTETIAAQDAPEHGSQQTNQDFAPPRGRYRIDHIPCRHKGPQEALGAIGPPTRLVDVQHRLILQLLFQFLTGGGDGLAGFFPALLRAPQTDVDSQNLRQQGFHYPARQAADDGQIGDQGGQSRAEVPTSFLGQRRARAFATPPTDHAIALIFSGVRLDRRQFGHLMPLRFPRRLHLLDLGGQRKAAVPTLFRQDGANLVDLGERQQGPIRPAMAGLGAHLAPALLPSAPLSRFAGQPIGGRRLGRVGRILFAQCQLALQIRDPLFRFRDLPYGLRNLPFGLRNLLPLVSNLLRQLADLLFLLGQLLAQPFVLLLQVARLPIATPRPHPPYGRPRGGLCPVKSTRVRDLLRLGQPECAQKGSPSVGAETRARKVCLDTNECLVAEPDRSLVLRPGAYGSP